MAVTALSDILHKIIGGPFPDGDSHCYFEPPTNKQMHYPCIVYKYENDDDDFADNAHYRSSKRYSVTVIDKDPDSEIPNRLKNSLPYCTPDTTFTYDGLKHFVYTLFYSGPRINKEENNNGQN